MTPRYINTDLEIESKEDLTPIVDGLGDDVVVLHHGEVNGLNRAGFEIAGGFAGADETVDYLCMLVEALSEPAAGIWKRSVSRVLNLGYESGDEGSSFRSELRADTLKRLSELGASVVVTIYPVGTYGP